MFFVPVPNIIASIAESPDFWQRKLSRRELFTRYGSRALIIVGTGLLIGDIGYGASVLKDRLDNGFPSTEATFNYAKEVQRIFDVRLTEQPNTTWTDERVLIVGEHLSHLPQAMYAPRGDIPMDIELQPASSGQEAICCAGSYNTASAKIHYVDKDIRPEYPSLVADTQTHEVGHYRSFSLNSLPQILLQGSIGVDFDEFSAEVNSNMSEEFKRFPVFQTADSIPQHIMRELQYGVTNIDELIAVLCEIYTWGKSAFSEISQWVGDVRAQQFYEIVRTQMFDEKEYKSHAEIEGKLKFDSSGRPIVVGFLGIDKTKK